MLIAILLPTALRSVALHGVALYSVALYSVALYSVALYSAEVAPAPPAAPVSTYAPATDLLEQVDFFTGRVSESLAAPAAFDLAKQSRTLKDANTLAVLALALALHDQDFPQKAAMPALLQAAQQLAAADADYAKASLALAQIKAARQGQAPAVDIPKWEKVASLPLLMKQVPLIHTALKRGIDPRRLARQKAQAAGQAAALAAIAQASQFDDEYAKTPEQIENWRRLCGDMRDAAGSVNAAIAAADLQRVDESMKRLTQSCDACHAAFRHP
ncbi:MAG: hypothetical protein AB7O59_08985 [Pirellulales bacterium]